MPRKYTSERPTPRGGAYQAGFTVHLLVLSIAAKCIMPKLCPLRGRRAAGGRLVGLHTVGSWRGACRPLCGLGLR